MSHGRGVVMGLIAIASASAFASVACNPSTCAGGATREAVRGGSAVNQEYVCVYPGDPGEEHGGGEDAEPSGRAGGSIGGLLDASFVSPTDDTDAGADAASDAGTTPVCSGVGPVGLLDVRVLTEQGATPAPPTGIAPDGVYILDQATWRATDGGAPPLLEFRAEVAVTGGRVTLSAAGSGAPDVVESSTAVVAGGFLTTVCVAGPGTAATELFPGSAGASEPAVMGWDGSALTLAIRLPDGVLALAFFPQ